jgi:hypothetical protein
VRSWLLIARVAFVGVLAALASASDGSASPTIVTVTLTASGPSPSTAVKSPLDPLEFLNQDSVAHTVVFAAWHCGLDNGRSLVLSPGSSGGCRNEGPTWTGSFAYTEDGKFPGRIHVVGLRRSVSLTARTHTVALGSQLTLHGQLTFDNAGAPFCAQVFHVFLLARHDSDHPFTRIAMFAVGPPRRNMKASEHGCTYAWGHKVRPGIATTYMAGAKWEAWWWRRAKSHPFTVRIRP